MPEKLPVLTDADILARLPRDLPGWTLEGGWLRRKYSTDGWQTTLMLVNAIGFLCEAAYHHPDLEVTWGKIWVKLKTHSSGGITERDFAMAKEIEKAATWRPAPDSELEGTPNKWVQAKKD
jgi:4a-hydroxytetrahydrobiopterin dehydratase